MNTALTLEPNADRQPDPPDRRRRRHRIVAGVVALLLVAAVAFGAWWFLLDDAPDAVSLESATQTLDAGTEAASTDTAVADTIAAASADTVAADAAGAVAATDVTGTWAVDTTVGTFDDEDSTGTFAGFRIEEELTGVGSTTAVGRTPDVTGTITIDGTTLTAATFEADMTAITTNDSRRDDKVQNALETSTFPTATFVLTEPIDLGTAVTSGESITVDAVGELTIHGVTTTATIPLQAQLVDGTIVVVGSLDITFSDYGVSVPSAPIVVSAEDHGVLELQLFFTQS